MTPLYERYRPKSFEEVVGQDAAVAQLLGIRERTGFAGEAFALVGASGLGKTTLARLIAAEVADDCCTIELNATEMSLAQIREIEDGLRFPGWIKAGRAVIVNEFHAMRKASIQQMLDTLERIPDHAVWIFTASSEGKDLLFEDCIDAGPLMSRCVEIKLTKQGFCGPAAKRLLEIATRENLGTPTLASCENAIRNAGNNLRKAIQFAQRGGLTA